MKSSVLVAVLAALACGISVPAQARNSQATPVRMVAPAPLSSAAAADLVWMREEEKLARDVYLSLYAAWKQPVFQRIATSEQRHFDSLGVRLSQYGLADPALPAQGQFANVELQALHDQLLASGKQSYLAALTVGATIEDVDIADLQTAISTTDNFALRTTYQNLLEGSKNHLRAFVGLLRDQGADYTPQYIDAVLYDAIVGD